ncbi:hypothetical protein COOONC_22873 [Cooperia oncophora]
MIQTTRHWLTYRVMCLAPIRRTLQQVVHREVLQPAGGAPPQIKPGAGGMAGTFDPNYQTLAGMNADVFVK